MKAMVIEKFGGPEVFVPRDVPVPQVRAGHVLIRVAASSVNPIDTKVRSGAVPAVSPDFPAVLHGDVAGTVEAVGEGVSRFKAGDAVFGCAGGFKGLGGALAEFMLADAALLAHKPATLSLDQAAALPIVGITAWEALVERAAVRPGQRVLIHGAAGGVGSIGVQLAKIAGAVVHTTVSSDEKAAIARRLGADVVINYKRTSVPDYVAECTGGKGFDVVFDTVGGPNMAASFQAARPGGTVVAIAARSTQDLSPMHAKGLTLHCVLMLLPLIRNAGRERHGQILTSLSRLIDLGRLCPLLDPQIFPFSDVAGGHRKLEAGQAVGKIRLEARF